MTHFQWAVAVMRVGKAGQPSRRDVTRAAAYFLQQGLALHHQYDWTRSSEPWLFRAKNALKCNHLDEAEDDLQRTLALEPQNAESQRLSAELKARCSESIGVI